MIDHRGPVAAATAALDRAQREASSQTIVISGEAGIGKTTFLERLLLSLDERVLVVRASGVEGERTLPLAGVIDLLRPLRSSFAKVREPHLSTLESAVDRGEPASPLALGLAVLHLLEALVAEHPLTVIVVDDGQWFDEVSANTIQFAFRRLGSQPAALVVATRSREWPGIDADCSVLLHGIDDETSRTILAAWGPTSLEVAAAANRACGGNPLALEQLGPTLTAEQRLGRSNLPDVMPIGGRLRLFLGRRIDALPLSTQLALAVLAATGPGDGGVLPAALDRIGSSGDDLELAEKEGVVVVDAGDYRFTHPLLRSAALSDPARRRIAHRALADQFGDAEIERRSHHLDLAADGPDDVAADALARAAQRAASARSYEIAASAWHRAARRSTDRATRAAHLTAASTSWWRADRPDLGIPIGEEALAVIEPGAERAHLALALGDMLSFWRDVERGASLIVDEAHDIDEADPALAGVMLCQAANLIALSGDLRRAVAVSETGHARAVAGSDPIAVIGCESIGAHLSIIHGRDRSGDARADGLVALGQLIDSSAPEALVQLGQLIVFDLLALNRWDEARALGGRVAAASRTSGLAGVEIFTHGLLGEIAWRRGRWIEARAESLIEFRFNELRDDPTGSFAHATIARVDAATGQLESCRRNGALAVEHGRATRLGVLQAWGSHALALGALADGEPLVAVGHLESIHDLCRQGEIGAPGALWWQGDLVEAYWRTRQSRPLERLVAELADDADRTGCRWAEAIEQRGRGLLDLDIAALHRSGEVLHALGARFESARSRGLIGEVAPVDDHRAELEATLREFEALGARPWAKRLASLLGEPVGSSFTTTPMDLTRAELKVAVAISKGLSNQGAADALCLSPKTIDSHLHRIYRKLGLRSRTELALLMSRQASDGVTHPPVFG